MKKRSLNDEINDLVNGVDAGDGFYEDNDLEEGGITTTQRINSLSRDFVNDDSDITSSHTKSTSMKARASEPELDPKFSGKKATRADLSRWFAGEDDDDDVANDVSGDDDVSENDEEEDDDVAESGDKDEMMTKAAAEAERMHRELLKGSGSKKGKKNDVISIIDKQSIETDFEKAKDTKTQSSLWEVLVESRIKLQQSLNVINGSSPLFAPAKIAAFEAAAAAADPSSEEARALADSRKMVSETFAMCVDVIRGLWDQNSEVTASCGAYADATAVLSDNDDVTFPEKDTSPLSGAGARFRRGEDSFMKGFCAPVLDRWYQRTQVGGVNSAADARGSKKFKLVNQDINTQIDQVLRDRQRLLQRTRINRLRQASGAPSAKRQRVEDDPAYDPEVFDDTDFYSDLLRELISSGGGGAGGVSGGSGGDARENLFGSDANSELNRIRSLRKKGKKTNTNASNKGRRINYDIIPELVSFMAPVDSTKETHTEWDTQQLYSNLFAAK